MRGLLLHVSLLVTFYVADVRAARLPYVVGGHDVAQAGHWPWQASLQQDGKHMCGAALISDRWLVTAAHCSGAARSKYSVILGAHDIATLKLGNPTRYTLSRILVHPDWSPIPWKGFPNDIALLYLSKSADLSSKFVSTVALPNENQSFLGSNCVITGWGGMKGQAKPNILQEAPVDVLSKEECQKKWRKVTIGDYQICVGIEGKTGGCGGDSGGPLVCESGSSWTLAGVTSFGRSDCNPKDPTIYTRLTYFRSWIKRFARL